MKTAREIADAHYWKTCCPNRDYEGYQAWLREGDNNLFVADLAASLRQWGEEIIEECAARKCRGCREKKPVRHGMHFHENEVPMMLCLAEEFRSIEIK